MMVVTILVGVAILGAVMGSFIGAQVWRVRARQLVEDKQAGEPVDTRELRRLKPLLKPLKNDRSRCLSCGHELRWYDLLPVVSWLAARGRCRYCQAPIGWMELGLEVAMAGLFMAVTWHGMMTFTAPLVITKVAIMLMGLSYLAFLFVYDKRWFLLPDVANWPFVMLGALFAAIHVATGQLPSGVLGLIAAVIILSGVYALLYVVSSGRWIGFGDVKLTLGLALFLMDWRLAFLALFLANLLGTLLVLPGMLRGTVQRGARIPFGPLLIVGFLISWFFGARIVDWLIVI
jgi:prepilin signal peptidase PulO-like enzyme (type II secretory pathway)